MFFVRHRQSFFGIFASNTSPITLRGRFTEMLHSHDELTWRVDASSLSGALEFMVVALCFAAPTPGLC
jgi:hypothetical protein